MGKEQRKKTRECILSDASVHTGLVYTLVIYGVSGIAMWLICQKVRFGGLTGF
jgi:hypothetical protein